MASAPSEDSDQPGHPPSLIRVFAVRMKKAWVLSYSLSRCLGRSESSDTVILLVLSWGSALFWFWSRLWGRTSPWDYLIIPKQNLAFSSRRLWSDWANTQADLSLRWAHSHFVGFVTRRFSSDSDQVCGAEHPHETTWPSTSRTWLSHCFRVKPEVARGVINSNQ